jgi:hypothetical protein
MTESTKRNSNAEAQARYRRGVAHQLKAIDAKIETLRAEVHQVLASNLVRRSISTTESQHAD